MQIIDSKPIKIRVKNEVFMFKKPYFFFKENEFKPIKAVVSGSQLVWHIHGEKITYKKLQKLLKKITHDRNNDSSRVQ